jgi:hypothetical protein
MSIISKKNGDSYLYFKNTSAQKFSVINSASRELYELPSVAPTENGQVIAVNVDGSSEFVNNTAVNALVADQPLVIPTQGSVILSDGISSTGTNTNPNFNFNIDPQNNPTLTVGGVQMISQNNNMFLRSAGEIITQNDMILKGTADIQRSFQHGTNNNSNYVKTYVDKDNFNFITDNQIGSVTEFKGSSQYDFDNTIYVNGTELTPGNPNALVADNPLVTP